MYYYPQSAAKLGALYCSIGYCQQLANIRLTHVVDLSQCVCDLAYDDESLVTVMCDKADASEDAKVRHTTTTTTTTTGRVTTTHERSVDVTRWQLTDIDLWLDSNDLKHLKDWYCLPWSLLFYL